MNPWIGVMIGGALGALARHATSTWITARISSGSWSGFPLATLVINASGSFLLSFVVTLALAGLVPPVWRVALASGFLGAYTTFSTFELESDALLRDGAYGRLALYLAGNLGLGYAGILLGRALALRLPGVH